MVFCLHLNMSNNKTQSEMNYLEQTTILICNNGTEYKYVRLQQYNDNGHKASNKYFINGKQVKNAERSMCENEIDNAHPSRLIDTEKSWTK